ncbi:hypothetical protein JXB41_07755 [Candidatus Woesearchaeota archaeon]|nr:hypothetical protein [Candidatus Woesearchaeota archaeon]
MIEQLYIFNRVEELEKKGSIAATALATGDIRFCINYPPFLNHTCNNTAFHNINYICQVNATDQNLNQVLSFYSQFLTNQTLFSISPSGLISFTPNGTQVGNHTYRVIVYDNSSCDNNYDIGEFNLSVICTNNPPVLNNTCNNTAFEDVNYYCQVNANDIDPGATFTFYSELINSTFNLTLFNITEEGIIDFTANDSFVGNYTYKITVYDNDYCDNSDEEYFNIEVIDTNDAPIFTGPIPNQTWVRGTTLAGFIDLDDYFYDPDGDPLTYTYSILNYIQVIVDENNEVTLIPVADFTGTEYITFIAYDPYDLNATSNDITLTVVPPTEEAAEEEEEVTEGGGGGGGYPRCIPEWYCKQWGDCMPDGYQSRVCFDLHYCNSTWNKPNTTQPCNFIHTCYDGIQGPEEQGVDCGGICPPCASCYDNIQNQGETGIDCGGPCKPCAIIAPAENLTGIKSLVEKPSPIERFPWLTSLMMIIILVLGILVILHRFKPQLFRWILPFIKRRKKKKEKLLLKEKYKETILEKLAKFQRKIPKTSKSRLIDEFSGIVREYFRNLFNFDHEFTYEELIDEIKTKEISKNIKDMLLGFFTTTTEIEFGGKKIEKAELYTLVSEFIEIIKLTSISAAPPEKDIKSDKEFLEKVKSKKKSDEIFLEISEAHLALRKNKINEAYSSYMKVINDYQTLSGEDKKRTNKFIKRLYEEIKSNMNKRRPKR